MLKHSETIINSSIRRQDSTWDYRWQYYNPDDPDTIYLDPQMTVNDGLLGNGWRFCGNNYEPSIPNANKFDRKNPFLQYHVLDSESGEGPDSETDEWDEEHPNNLTRYLRPGDANFISISKSIKNVTINPVPPKFISDYGTEYLSLESTFDNGIKNKAKKILYTINTRTINFEFQDEVGLDFKQFALYTGDTEIDWGNITGELPDNILYYYDRTLDKALKQHYIESLSIQSSKSGNYEVNATLYEKWADLDEHDNIIKEYDIKDILNIKSSITPIEYKVYEEIKTKEKYTESQLNLIVWDLAGNYSIYHIKRPFNTLYIDDLNSLVPVNIIFTKVEPDNYYINSTIACNIYTKVQNTNICLFEYENVAQLIEQSVGQIDDRSYKADDNRTHIPLDGIREFIIGNIQKSGNVIVEAWVETGFPEVDAVIKDKTYNTAICGPWIYGDEGRKYNIVPDTPKYLRNTEFGDFIEFFELYINTIYKNMDGDKNISALEKIARIGNFNDIQHLEDALVYHYGIEYGNEFDFNIESLQNVNLITNGLGFTNRDVKDTFDIVKYVLEQLPNYNQYKGTNTGIQMAIKMFGFTCKIINMWIKKEDPIDYEPNFLEENGVYSVNDYFMTSRFNIELEPGNNLFETFVNNVDMFIKIVKSIKPLCKILNKIKYTIYINKNLNLIYNLNKLTDITNDELTYKLKWSFSKNTSGDSDYINNLIKICNIDETTGTGDLLCLHYKPTCTLSNNSIKKPINVYNVLGRFFDSNYDKLYLRFSKQLDNEQNKTKITYEFNKNGIIPVLNSGGLFLYFNEASNATHCYNIMNKFYKIFRQLSLFEIELWIKLQSGTDYAVSLQPT